jgi:hypothetical protein
MMETYAERLKKFDEYSKETPEEFKKRLARDLMVPGAVGSTITDSGKDENVENVVKQLRWRAEKGLAKYGVTTERKDLSTIEWLQHLQEELMDASVYIEKLKNEIKKED